jgi:hypothetical protein
MVWFVIGHMVVVFLSFAASEELKRVTFTELILEMSFNAASKVNSVSLALSGTVSSPRNVGSTFRLNPRHYRTEFVCHYIDGLFLDHLLWDNFKVSNHNSPIPLNIGSPSFDYGPMLKDH